MSGLEMFWLIRQRLSFKKETKVTEELVQKTQPNKEETHSPNPGEKETHSPNPGEKETHAPNPGEKETHLRKETTPPRRVYTHMDNSVVTPLLHSLTD